jgi:hypothetical protein
VCGGQFLCVGGQYVRVGVGKILACGGKNTCVGDNTYERGMTILVCGGTILVRVGG